MKNYLLKFSALTLILFFSAQLLAQNTIQLPVANTGSANNRGPSGSRTYHYTCAIYPGSEIGNLNSSIINSVGFTINAAANIAVTGNIKIYLENTNDAAYSKPSDLWTNVISTMTLVYNGPVTIPINSPDLTINLTTPFTHNSGGMYLAYEYSNPTGTRSSGSATYACNNLLALSLKTATSGNATPPTSIGPTASAFRPSITWGYVTNGEDVHVVNLATGFNKVENGSYQAAVRIANTGNTNVPAGYPIKLVDGSNVILSETGPAVNAGDTVLYQFNGSWSPALGDNLYNLTAQTENASDVVTINDNYQDFHYVFSKYSLPLREDFNDPSRFFTLTDGLSVPSGWSVLNEDGSFDINSYNWYVSTGATIPNFEGSQSIGNNFNAANGLLIDDWLIAPLISDYDDNIIDSLVFYTTSFNSQFADSIEIRLAPNNSGSQASDFTQSVAYFNVPKTGWTRFAFKLNNSLPAGTTSYRVALRYYIQNGGPTGNNSDVIGIDALSINRYLSKPIAVADQILCENDSVVLSVNTVAGATSYTWTGPNGFTSNSQSITLYNVTSQEAGEYYVVASNSVLISEPDTVLLTIYTTPLVSVTSNQLGACEGDDLQISVFVDPVSSNILWSGPNSFNSIQADNTITNVSSADAGNYTVSVEYNGCYAPDNTIQVIVEAPPGADLGPDTTLCNGSVVALTCNSNTSGIIYNWSTSETSQSINVSSVGTYSVSVQTPIGACISRDTIIVTLNDSVVSANASYQVVSGLTVDFTNTSIGGTNYQWDFDNDGNVDNFTESPTFTFPSTAIYTVHLTVTNACGNSDDTLIVVDLVTGIRNVVGSTLSITPNPTNNFINLKFNAVTEQLAVEMVATSGQIVYTEKVNHFSGAYNKQIDMSSFANGIYYIRLITNDGVVTKKIVKN